MTQIVETEMALDLGSLDGSFVCPLYAADRLLNILWRREHKWSSDQGAVDDVIAVTEFCDTCHNSQNPSAPCLGRARPKSSGDRALADRINFGRSNQWHFN